MTDTCSVQGCTRRVVCVVQDLVERYDRRTGETVTQNDGPPKGLCHDHQRKYQRRRGRPIEGDHHQTHEEEQTELPF